MSQEDLEYLERRAQQEIGLAQQARRPEVVAVHYALSELYLERLAQKRSEAGPADAIEQVSDERGAGPIAHE